jgi:hypothetical protein
MLNGRHGLFGPSNPRRETETSEESGALRRNAWQMRHGADGACVGLIVKMRRRQDKHDQGGRG